MKKRTLHIKSKKSESNAPEEQRKSLTSAEIEASLPPSLKTEKKTQRQGKSTLC